MDLQELVGRGKFLFSGAPDRLRVFQLVNGRRTAKEIAKALRRSATAVSNDLARLRDAGMIELRRGPSSTAALKKNGAVLYDKLPLAKTIPPRYFLQATNSRRGSNPSGRATTRASRKPARKRLETVPMPSEADILGICENGEDQLHEFKAAGTEVRKIVKEVAAMANTSQGGLVLYGVADDGKVHGSDLSRQKFDQPLQNSVRGIDPPLTVRLHSVTVLGNTVLVILVPPWNGRDVYHFEERILIRKGTNAFPAKAGESKKLYSGTTVV